MAKISIILLLAAAGQTLATSLREASATTCGNGVMDAGEECDSGPCCTSECTFVSFGTTCESTLPTGAFTPGMCQGGVCTPMAEVAPVTADEDENRRLLGKKKKAYQLRVKDTTLCMTRGGTSTHVFVSTCNNSPEQRFVIKNSKQHKTELDGGAVIMALGTQQCVDYNYSNGDIYMYPCHGKSNQKFYMDWRGNVVTRYNGYCLDRHLDTNNLYGHPCHGGDNQVFVWELIR